MLLIAEKRSSVSYSLNYKHGSAPMSKIPAVMAALLFAGSATPSSRAA